jgi:hypothetical protein
MANAAHRHLPRIKDASGVNRYGKYIWNGFAWEEHSPYVNCEKTNMWLYNNGTDNTEITGGWISEGWHFRSDHYGVKKALGLTKNSNSMTITNNSTAVYDGDSGIVHIADDADLTPYSVLRFKVDYKMVNSSIVLGAMPKGSTLYASNSGANVSLTGVNDVKGAEIAVDVSALKGAYDIFIGIVAWASNNSATVYEVELR